MATVDQWGSRRPSLDAGSSRRLLPGCARSAWSAIRSAARCWGWPTISRRCDAAVLIYKPERPLAALAGRPSAAAHAGAVVAADPGPHRVDRPLPGSWIGTANLPANIARSWARWGRSRHYVCDARGRAAPTAQRAKSRFPIRWLSFYRRSDRALRGGRGVRPYYPGRRSSAGIWRRPISVTRRSAISASSASRCRARRGMTLLLGSSSVCRGRATPVARLYSRRRHAPLEWRAPGADWAPTEGLNAFLEKRPAAFKGR